MRQPVRAVMMRGEVEYRDEADSLLKEPGDAVLVKRGQPRALVMRCPDGCGETLAVNLDPRAGKAWRLDTRRGGATLYPSVWREGGCGSHFIVWRGRILWCDRFERDNVEPPYDPALEEIVYHLLDASRLRSAEELADELDELPWEVSRAGRRLVQRGYAEAGLGRLRDHFRKR